MLGRRKVVRSLISVACEGGLDSHTTDELLQLVKLTDDRAHLWCACQRSVWAEIARRGGIPFKT
jgi:hypothetical protein